MSKIKVLPDILANQIAAGEIVERPASVVKELIENSIDAQSQRIEIDLLAGGKQRIRVKDDGEGMSHDDAILAFEHHATSKISHADDLLSIGTLGFRGEALPSIASVSHLSLRTIERGASSGTEVEINGGVMKKVKELAWDNGTEVAVRDLFFNIPARRKFLKSTDTELGHVTRLVTQYALAHPDVAFTLAHQERELLCCTPVGSLEERIYQLMGESFLSNLVAFRGAQKNVTVHGFASPPHEQRTNPYSQFFFVNKRTVRDRLISHAIAQAYKAVIPSSLYPVIILFIEIPADQIDVNVHPSKMEIRFREPDVVHELIKASIQAALLQKKSFPEFVPTASKGSAEEASTEPSHALRPSEQEAHREQARFQFGFREVSQAAQPRINQEQTSTHAFPQSPFESPRLSSSAQKVSGDPARYEMPRELSKGRIRAVGQLHDSFILAADADGLLIVDQHVAHERVLYEKTLAQMQSEQILSQHLLVPLTFDLTPAQQVSLSSILPELNRNGFEVEQFGGSTIAVKSVPVVASECDVKLLITGILDSLEAGEPAPDMTRIQEKIAASVACRAAIKINTPLTHEKMQWLIDELVDANVSTHCPHGRPIVLRLGIRDIEKNFKRI